MTLRIRAKTLRTWLGETGALLPTGSNPHYDLKAERPRGNQGGNNANQGLPGKNKGKKKDIKQRTPQ